MSQRVKDIHGDLITADQWTALHSPWQNLAKLLKLHAQVLMNRTNDPDNLRFLAQDYLSHIHNLSENHQLKWKISEQVSGGEPDISYMLMFNWFEPVLYLNPVSKFQ
jgi:arylsulfatase A-like enzyme